MKVEKIDFGMHFGKVSSRPPKPWRGVLKAEPDDDDDSRPAEPDVVAILGFDPDELDE